MASKLSAFQIKQLKRANRMSYLQSLFVSIDQLANVLAAGNPDNTISARVGRNVYHDQGSKIAWYWIFFRWSIDKTFYPIDGPNHCKEAYQNDNGEFFYDSNNLFAIVMMAIFILIPCSIIIIILHLAWLIGFVSPKYIDRYTNIQRKITLSQAKLQGAVNELDDNIFMVDKKLPTLVIPVINTAQELKDKLEDRV